MLFRSDDGEENLCSSLLESGPDNDIEENGLEENESEDNEEYLAPSQTNGFDLKTSTENLNEYDLIRYYLHEIAGHSLLSREEEISIAKEIKKGKRITAKSILASPLMLNEVVKLGDKLKKGTLSVRDITSSIDDDTDDYGEEEILFGISRSLNAIKRLCQENERIKKQMVSAAKSNEIGRAHV